MGIKSLVKADKRTSTEKNNKAQDHGKSEAKKVQPSSFTILDECVRSLSPAERGYGYMLKFEDFVNAFENLLKQANGDSDYEMKLISTCNVHLIPELFKFYKYDGLDPVHFGIQKNLLAALYVVCKKHNMDYQYLISDIVDIPYEAGVEDDVNKIVCRRIFWSFESFSEVLEYALKNSIDIEDVYKDLNEVFQNNFDVFVTFADEDDIRFLKKFIISKSKDDLEIEDWYDFLEERYPFFWEGSFIGDVDKTIILCEYFPELRVSLCVNTISSFVDECFESEEESKKRNNAEDLVKIFQYIADYSQYQACVLSFKATWKKILTLILTKFDGNTLTSVMEVLWENFYVSKEEIKAYVVNQTMALLNGISENTNLDEKEYVDVEHFNSVERMNMICRQLSNPIVFETVAMENYSIIEAFDY